MTNTSGRREATRSQPTPHPRSHHTRLIPASLQRRRIRFGNTARRGAKAEREDPHHKKHLGARAFDTRTVPNAIRNCLTHDLGVPLPQSSSARETNSPRPRRQPGMESPRLDPHIEQLQHGIRLRPPGTHRTLASILISPGSVRNGSTTLRPSSASCRENSRNNDEPDDPDGSPPPRMSMDLMPVMIIDKPQPLAMSALGDKCRALRCRPTDESWTRIDLDVVQARGMMPLAWENVVGLTGFEPATP